MSINKFIIDFWTTVVAQDKEKLKEYFCEDARIRWHCTNEEFNLNEYIIANCEFPGQWKGQVERLIETDEVIITVIKVWSEEISCHVTSFIKMKDNKIKELDEYYGDDGQAPKWRQEKHIGRYINDH